MAAKIGFNVKGLTILNGGVSLELRGPGLLYGDDGVKVALTREEATHLCRDLQRELDLDDA